MKRIVSIMLAALMLLAVFAGCAKKDTPAVSGTDNVSDSTANIDAEPQGPFVYEDGRARPSSCGRLKVVNGKLCSESGEPVMLRGASSYGLITGESYINDKMFGELAKDHGFNLYRLAMYTYGMGTIGYCAKGDKERHKEDIDNGVNLALKHDMYVIIDWHILSDGNPNKYVDESKLFFAEMAEKYKDYDNVLYEICNEPNGEGVDWACVKQYANEVIPIIREKDPNAVIIVGTPEWSRLVDQALADPLDYDNLMYTFHFYSATHGDDIRDMVENVSKNGLPIFVTEFGITHANGNAPYDIESGDAWIEMLEREKISYCMWSFSSVAEASAAIKHNVLKSDGIEWDDLTKAGQWLFKTIEAHPGK